jgi:hypothetical protein
MPSRVRPAHARRAVTALCSPTHRWLNYTRSPPRPSTQNWLQATTRRSRREARERSSLVRQSGRRRPTVSWVKTPVKSEKKSLARSLSCTWVAWTLGNTSSVTESTGVRAHRRRRRSPAGCVVEAGAPAQRSRNLGQKKRDCVRSACAKVIGKWLSQSSANW